MAWSLEVIASLLNFHLIHSTPFILSINGPVSTYIDVLWFIIFTFQNQITVLKSSHPTLNGRATLVDPAVNLLINSLRKELATTRAKLEETQNELTAWKFTPDSNTGKKLMAKCRLLHQENEELGRMTSSGRIAKLEGDLALQKSFCEEVKKSQSGNCILYYV